LVYAVKNVLAVTPPALFSITAFRDAYFPRRPCPLFSTTGFSSSTSGLVPCLIGRTLKAFLSSVLCGLEFSSPSEIADLSSPRNLWRPLAGRESPPNQVSVGSLPWGATFFEPSPKLCPGTIDRHAPRYQGVNYGPQAGASLNSLFLRSPKTPRFPYKNETPRSAVSYSLSRFFVSAGSVAVSPLRIPFAFFEDSGLSSISLTHVLSFFSPSSS